MARNHCNPRIPYEFLDCPRCREHADDTGGFNVHYKRLERSDLSVRVMGDCALMTGRQLLVGERKNGTGTVTIDSRVMQIWVKEGERWQQSAFQTTPTEMSVTSQA